ncbi:MAG: DMT family transporter [Anaerolineae bacterium]|nr:DMT family transporter [Anaerolineae bacterium]
MQRWRADLALGVVTLIWGSTFVIVKHTLDSLGPFTLIAARFWTAGAVLGGLWLWQKKEHLRPRRSDRNRLDTIHHPSFALHPVVRDGILTGLVLTGGFITQTLGLQTTEAGKAAFITGLNVVIVPVLSALLLRKPPTRIAVAGVVLATLGLGLLTLDRTLRLATGDLWVLLCAVGFALHIIVTAHFTAQHAVLPFTLVQLFTVAVTTSLIALIIEGGLALTSNALPAIIYLGVAATAVVFGLQTWAQQHTTPTHTALIFALEPVFAALFALVLARELLVFKEWMGGALILMGMVIAEIQVGPR